MLQALVEGGVLKMIPQNENDRPTLQYLSKHVVRQAAHKWRNLGEQLLNDNQRIMLKVIEADHPHNVVSCCKHALETWLKSTPDASWNQLISALRSPTVQLDSLADELEKMMRTELNTIPLLKDLYKHITPRYAVDWKVIGTLLDLSSETLDIIEHDNHYKANECCNAMWGEWLERDTTASWGKLFTVIESPALSRGVLDKGSDRPKLKDLCRHVVKQAAHKWRDLGELLELESYKMEMTAFNHSHDIDMCCMDVLMTWLDTTPNASWNQLIRALRSVQLNYLADQLEEMLSIKLSTSTSDSLYYRYLSSSSSSDSIKENLTCQICNQLYKNPKFLSCYHSCCEECLEKIQTQSRITFPECSKETAVPAGGVKDLPNNTFINRIMRGLEYQKTNETFMLEIEQLRESFKKDQNKLETERKELKLKVEQWRELFKRDLEYQNKLETERKELKLEIKQLRESSKETKEDSSTAKENINEAILAHVIPVSGPHQINCDGQSGGCFVWNECGLEINFPPKCSQQHIQVTTSSFLPTKNEVHPGMHIVSAVYQFNCNIKRFDKAFTLRFEHCIKLRSPEDCQKVHFVIQHDDSNDMKHGHFEIGNSYGTVNLNRFCRIFLVWINDLWRNICTIVLPVTDQDNTSLQVSGNQQSSTRSEAHSEEVYTSQIDHTTLSQSTSGQQHDSTVPSSSGVASCDTGKECTKMKNTSSPVYKYESMIGLPKDYCHLTNWSGVYSIYVKLGGWRKVSKESILKEGAITNFPVNYYANEIEFDTDGVAMIRCEKASESSVDVNCWPYQIKQEDVDQIHEHCIDKCGKDPLCINYDNILSAAVRKSVIRVTKTTDTPSSNCQLMIKGIKPHQQVDLCESCFTNLTLVGTIDSRSTTDVKGGPVPVGTGLKENNINIDISPLLRQSGILNTKPKMWDLINIVSPQLKAEWETIAYILHYDTPTIDSIKALHQKDPKNCCRELLKDWLETPHGVSPKTWFILLNTIAENEDFTRTTEVILDKLEKKARLLAN